MKLTKQQLEEDLIDDLIANKFIDYLDENGIDCEDEDEAVCIFDQLIGEAIENQ